MNVETDTGFKCWSEPFSTGVQLMELVRSSELFRSHGLERKWQFFSVARSRP